MKQIFFLIINILILCSCSKDEIIIDNPETNDQETNDTDTSTNSDSMKLTIGNITFKATLASNATATAFKARLPLTLNMNDFNSNEKVCSLSSSLPTAASNPGTINTGDIMLYGSSSIVLFYETFSTSYSYTRIGKVDNVAGLKDAIGNGNVNIRFELE